MEKGSRGLTLRALNSAARAAGLRRGQSHADACAIAPELASVPAEPDREQRALEQLALWCERWSPAVTIDPSPDGLEGLFLDMTGAAHLFGGEAQLLADMRRRLSQADIKARVAVADTAGAAWAAARWTEQAETVVSPEGARDVLAGLPLAGLRLDGETLTLARRFGLKRIGDLYPLPRAGLARRFRAVDGLGLVRRLDQALGHAAEALAPLRPPPQYRVWETYAEPICGTEGVADRLLGLADSLAAQMERDECGARALTLAGFRTDGATPSLTVRLGAASRRTSTWLRLFRETGLERLDTGFGLDALMLCAGATEVMTAAQAPLERAVNAAGGESLSELVDRLGARLGDGAVRRPQAQESWLPERSEILVPALAAPAPQRTRTAGRPRPTLLLDPPEPVEAIAELPDGAPARFTWRRVARRVLRAEGPERLAGEWWRPLRADRPARTRDYYRVEDEQGRRYWLFREGLYDREDADRAPSWWMHGMFP